MRLVEQWRTIEGDLPGDWAQARLVLTVAEESRAARAAAVLAPLAPGRHGRMLRFSAARRGPGFGPDHVRRLLGRLDRERVAGTLELASVTEEAVEAEAPRDTLELAWAALLATLPADWSDLLCEVELRASDQVERAALLLSPLNPTRERGRPALRFRAARRFGYGASPGNVDRCLARLDAEGIAGSVEVLRALSDTHPVATQGPVWYVGGKAV